jgi:hypothetical protein
MGAGLTDYTLHISVKGHLTLRHVLCVIALCIRVYGTERRLRVLDFRVTCMV